MEKTKKGVNSMHDLASPVSLALQVQLFLTSRTNSKVFRDPGENQKIQDCPGHYKTVGAYEVVNIAVEAYYFTLLSSKGNGNRFDLHENLLHDHSQMIICCFNGVQHARCKDNSVTISFRQNAT